MVSDACVDERVTISTVIVCIGNHIANVRVTCFKNCSPLNEDKKVIESQS